MSIHSGDQRQPPDYALLLKLRFLITLHPGIPKAPAARIRMGSSRFTLSIHDK